MTHEKDSGSRPGGGPERDSGGDPPQGHERIGEEMGALFKKALGLAAVVAGTGCMDKFDPSGRTFQVPYSSPPGQATQLCPRIVDSKDAMAVAFAEPLRFSRIGETVEATLHETYTLQDLQEVCGGTYALKATLRKGSTGGPPGTASELFVEESDKRLSSRLSPPPRSPSARALTPGEVVIRPIAEGQLAGVHDRYLVTLPGPKRIYLRFDPFPVEYEFTTTVALAETAIPVTIEKDGSDRYFETTRAGTYELTVRSNGVPPRTPDRYSFFLVWGSPISVAGYVPRTKWRTSPENIRK